MESHYMVNIAKITGTFDTSTNNHGHEGVHFFKVKVIGKNNANEVFNDLCEKYPHPMYVVSMAFWDVSGRQIASNDD